MKKYAVFAPFDQTIVYLPIDGAKAFTTKHSEVKLFDSRELAEQAALLWNVSVPDIKDCLNEFVELVLDEEEFRAQEDTW